MEMVYERQIAHLETVISYGSLGWINAIVKESRRNTFTKKNIFLINIATIVRNCFDKTSTDAAMIKAIQLDIDNLKMYIGNYNIGRHTVIIFYAHVNLRNIIPEQNRRGDTVPRVSQEKLLSTIVGRANNRLTQLDSESSDVSVYTLITDDFAYKHLAKVIQRGLDVKVRDVVMMTHSSIDYFITELIPQTLFISSHTGKLYDKSYLSQKVFKDDKIPFNRVTYKLFGDKELIKPIVSRRPKALELLGERNLKTKTERELIALVKSKLDITKDQLSWRL